MAAKKTPKEDVKAKLAKWKPGVTLNKKRQRETDKIEDIPLWVKVGLTMMEVYGMTVAEAVEAGPRKKGKLSLQHYGQSPAGKAWRAGIKKGVLNDQRELALSLIRASALGVTLDKLAALQMATEAGDYLAINRITDSLLDRADVTSKKGPDKGPTAIIINLGGGGRDASVLNTEGTIIEAEVIDEQDDTT